MNTTVTVQVDNLPAVQQELAEANAEIERLTAMVAVLSVNAHIETLTADQCQAILSIIKDGE